ncbi:hypothetical protein [Desertivirga xinjiangensis]|uniref:hypothetical protein n=1 Tax=Desertivirga xinjiangensis TaxID=539206 RepID=UPI002109B3BE|nr:hypothetical protein [Pedobacter xinjiangensis]
MTLNALKAQELPKPPVATTPQTTDFDHHLVIKSHSAELKKASLRLKAVDMQLKELTQKLKMQIMESIPDFQGPERAPSTPEVPEMNLRKIERQNKDRGTLSKVKKSSKLHQVDANDKLAINNQYGNVYINVWPKKEFKVDIEIKAFGNSERQAAELLDGVKIDEVKSSNLISYKTNIESGKSYGGVYKRGKDPKGVIIEYTVYMPGGNPLDIINKFGDVILPEFNGRLQVDNSYGSLKGGSLLNISNDISVKYGSVNLEKYVVGSINVSYGSLNIASASGITADVRYGSTKIGKVTNGGNLENKYGSLKIDEVDNNVKTLIINTDKGSVAVGTGPSSNFDFDVTVNMGGFYYPADKTTIISKTADEENGRPHFTKHYQGQYGKGSPARILVKTSYGSVKFQ